MVGPRWRKVLRDLWGHRARTALVSLSIAAGVTALGVVAATYVIVTRDLPAAYRAANPPSARVYADSFDDDLVGVLRNLSGVADVEGRRIVTGRVRVGGAPIAGEVTRWREIDLLAISDYQDIGIGKIVPHTAGWPPADRELWIERSALPLTGAQVGDTVLLRMPNDQERELRIAGLVYDVTQPPAQFVDRVYGYVTGETLAWLGSPADFNELQFVVTDPTGDREHVMAVAAEVRKRIERSGRAVYWTAISDPGKHPLERFIAPMAVLLTVLGALALGLSGFLVVNTISALLVQQIRQIGVMKAVGARTRQITGLYLGMVLALGLLALGLALPLGLLGARLALGVVTNLMNFDVTSFRVPLWVYLLQGAAALVVPMLAAILPVRAGTRLTVREAIASYGLTGGSFGRGLSDRVIARIRGLPRPMLLSLRNTFRRKARLILTLLTLGLGSAIFVAVFSVRASLLLTLDEALKYWQYDVGVIFNRSYRIDVIARETLAVPGVVAAESWGYTSARRERPDGTESDNLAVVAPPADTRLLQPIVLSGRWLVPDDENAVVVNTDLLRNEPDIVVGDKILLVIDSRETEWTVVGAIQGVLAGPTLYVNYPYYTEVARVVDRAGSVQIVTEGHTPAAQAEVARSLEAQFERSGLRVGSIQTTADLRSLTMGQFNVILAFLLVMAGVLAAVGALGLTGTMSINVLERTREIGVMRSIGATGGAIRQIVIAEGVTIGLLSWLLGVLLAIPVSQFLSRIVGISFLQAPLSYAFSFDGALIWLVAILALAALASVVPARAASRLSIREVLAYE